MARNQFGGATPPGPSVVERLGQARRMLTEDVTGVLTSAREEYGSVVDLTMPSGDPGVLLADPDAIQHVLEGNADNYRRASVYREELSELFGDGLLTSEGDLWHRQHRLIRPMFGSGSVRSFTDLIVQETDAMLDRWITGDEIDLLPEMERVTLSIIGKAMFSADVERHAAEIRDALQVLRRGFQREVGVIPTFPEWVPSPHNRRMQRAIDDIDAVVHELIEARRGRADEYDDLLSKLLGTRTDDGERMDDEQIRDELVTFLLAGHETTAAALTWTWYLLANNPGVHERLHDRVADADPTDVVGFSAGAAGSESFVKQCVQEAMRIYPPVPVITREAIDRDEIAGYEVPAGAEVVLSQFVVHRDPDLWEDPLAYRPERFAPGAADDRPAYSYFPFGGGQRICIGRLFALAEAQLILARVVSDVRLTLRSPIHDTPAVDSAVTMVPDELVAMDVTNWE
ncbi:Cytochrome P450 [Halorientalis persicus]|uniref:Cytochrome P450 n=1 Tax=Halorientalis persicus TaxID=1367881 RepID=A0A1H8MVA8_9EURY|nr:cytochrome P450 [Halorientalis persicus]SEO21143.1 Cytochrome P450 [Halorientalis persicus]